MRAYHDELLFLVAFPFDRRELLATEGELRRLAAVLRRDERLARSATLLDSGIAHTRLRYGFSRDLLGWLHSHAHAASLKPLWPADGQSAEFEEFLQLIATRTEADGLLEPKTSASRWLRLADRGGDGLGWLIRRVQAVDGPPALVDRVFDALNMQVEWRVTPAFSRTLNRFPARPPVFANSPPRRIDLRAELARPLPPPAKLSEKQREQLITTARATLAARSRETDPVTYASPHETTLLRLEDGVDVLLMGMTPRRRLPIESYFGFVAAINRVPAAYGGGWVFFDRCEIGVNLFEEFRGGQSALIFASVMRAYCRHYNVKQFLVDPYQFGADNEEAIASGAYWFYHRLGFRSVDARLAALAQREAEANAADPRRRTTPRALRKLATARLFMDVAAKGDRFRPAAPDLIRLSLGLTKRGEVWGDERWLRRLGIGRKELAGVRAALALKDEPRERDYALALQRCTAFRDAVMDLR